MIQLERPFPVVPILLSISFLAPGCRLGKENVVFTTSTVIGIDVDSVPPRVSLGYDRFEGSIGPTTQEGEILPLLAGIAMTTNVVLSTFGFGVSTTFATGPAAILAAKYLAHEADYEPANANEELQRDLDALGRAAGFGAREGSGEGTPTDEQRADAARAESLRGPVQLPKDHKLRRYFFATDTSLGFSVSFAAGDPNVPESVQLGWKRKELAIVPVTVLGEAHARRTLYLPSLVATSSTDVELQDSGGPATSQFYATGMAANYLMGHAKIRRNIVQRTGAAQSILDEDRRALAAIEARGIVAKERAGEAIDALADTGLEHALEVATYLGFRSENEFPASDEDRRAYLKILLVVGNDEPEVERLEALVVVLQSLTAPKSE